MAENVSTIPVVKPTELQLFYASLLELEDKLETAHQAELGKQSAAATKLLTDLSVANFDMNRVPERHKSWLTEEVQVGERIAAFAAVLKKVQDRLEELQRGPDGGHVVTVLQARKQALEARRATEQKEAESIGAKIRRIESRLGSVGAVATRSRSK